MKNILYISYDGMTDNLGQSQVIPYLTELTKKGFKFTVLSFEKPDKYKANKNHIAELMNKAKIDWHTLIYTSTPPVLSTIKDISKLIKTAKQLHKEKTFCLVHCRSYISAFAGVFLKKKYGVKFVFDMRGFWADERIDGKIWSVKNPIFKIIYNYFKKQEIKYLNTADYTISLTNNAKQEIHQWQHIKNNPIPIKVIPCCADFEHFKYSESNNELYNKAKKELGITPNNFILSYLGSVGTWYMLDEMLDFFKILIKTKPQSKFLFITGEPKQLIYKVAKAKNIDTKSIIVQFASRKMVSIYLALSHVSIFFIKPLYSKKASSPTKLAEIMSMKIPIICNANVGDVDTIIKKTKAGFVINSLSDNSYKQAISNIDELLKINRENIRENAEKLFSLSVGVNKYADVYSKILKNGN